ncbi:hypothetical protein RND61_09415 [Streptomyces sp. TRM76323]|uniref:Integral membrane protein n=1 Tax=Streptomyces tamarix TaxID=3078565 RepID=A0ABU3QHP9_9ACTN|nr:hypothetical protein [Streptomyces tamarix]MDT9682292.1 hypothetical protein [Streptomyces tamarix]
MTYRISALISAFGVLVSVMLLIGAVREYRSGASAFWLVAGTVIFLSALYTLVRDVRAAPHWADRLTSEPFQPALPVVVRVCRWLMHSGRESGSYPQIGGCGGVAALTKAAEARARTVVDGPQPKQPAADAADAASQ